MNLAKAIYYNSIAPENISQLVLNIVKGFENSKIRKLNYFDLFIIIPFYSYSPAQKQFERIVFNQINSFQRDVERNPEIFSNFNFQYEKSIRHIKQGILYALEKELIVMDDKLDITMNTKFTSDIKIIFNMGKVFSTKSTASLYNFFEVDINVI
ncbi:three component ABC system middle component [Sulfuricurvum sp.]|uniref:three component ABC system middle component n=1 Tax=Sulfuricurvum sp. TaxID=2025608 RepID=UPI00286DFFF1|nr:three component ABC system middle component [Sulfuricurvum sp.]